MPHIFIDGVDTNRVLKIAQLRCYVQFNPEYPEQKQNNFREELTRELSEVLQKYFEKVETDCISDKEYKEVYGN